MNKQQIIQSIADNKHYVSICKKIAKSSGLAEDLYQEFFVVLCEYNQEKLEGIQSRGELKFFCVSLLYQMFFYKTAPFHRKFRSPAYAPLDMVFDSVMNFKDEWLDEVDRFNTSSGLSAFKDILFISDEGYDFDTDVLLERIEGKIKQDLANCEDSAAWYSAKIFSLYMEEGSSRKLAKKVNIPYRSIAHTVQQYKQDLRKLSDGEAA